MRQLLYDLTLITWLIAKHLALLLTIFLKLQFFSQFAVDRVGILGIRNSQPGPLIRSDASKPPLHPLHITSPPISIRESV